MAKIMFVSINDVNAEGPRILSALLKQNGHRTYIVFLQRNGFSWNTDKKYLNVSKKVEEYDWVGINERGQAFRYSRGPTITATEKKLFLSLIEDIKPDLIGFTVTTPLKKRNAEISTLIKSRFDIPIVWGGIKPTIDTEECLNYCDFVCVGEGERTILDIATLIDANKGIKEANNLAYLEDERVVRNPLYHLINNLDELPFKDIYPDDKFLIDDNTLARNFHEVNYSRNFRYHTGTSRGCPNNCSYCNENFLKKLYFPENFLRRRSPIRIIEELKEAKKIIDYKLVHFEDEIFSFDYNWLIEFKDMYKKEINLPFICYIYPYKDIDKQLLILKEAGIAATILSIESGSERINREIFNRPFNKELFLKTAHMLKSMGISYHTDVITYNPFEEEKDLQATLGILNQLPKPFGFCINKLYIIKGTSMHKLVENLIRDKKKYSVLNRLFKYYSHLFWLAAKYDKHKVEFIQNIRLFKNFPFLINWFLVIMHKTKKIIKIFRIISNKIIKVIILLSPLYFN